MIADSITPDPPRRPPMVAGPTATKNTTITETVHYEDRCPTCDRRWMGHTRGAAVRSARACCLATHGRA